MSRHKELKMDIEGFKVQAYRDVWNRIMAYAQVCSQEISGFGETEIHPDRIILKSAFLINQKVTGVSTDLDPSALYDEVMSLASKGVDTSNWGLWWHSHVNMSTALSATDVSTIGLLEGDNPLVSLCVNKHNKYFCRVDMYRPFRLAMLDAEVEIIEHVDDTLIAECTKEMKEKVELSSLPKNFTALAASSKFPNYSRDPLKCLMCQSPREEGSRYCSTHGWLDSNKK